MASANYFTDMSIMDNEQKSSESIEAKLAKLTAKFLRGEISRDIYLAESKKYRSKIDLRWVASRLYKEK